MKKSNQGILIILYLAVCVGCTTRPGAAPWLSTPESIEEFRKQVEGMRPDTSRIEGLTIVDRKIQLQGRNLNIRIYSDSTERDQPAILWIHGACWVAGSLNSHDEICRYLAREGNLSVIAVDYRLAPEHPYPAAHDDVYDAYRWIWQRAEDLHVDPSRMAIGGESAGAYLAAATALRLRDEPEGPQPVFALLVYAALDGSGSSWEPCKQLYFKDKEEARSRYGSPLWADNLGRFPRTYNIFGEFEISRAEEELFIRKLNGAGVPAVNFMVPGVGHDVLNWNSVKGDMIAHRKAIEYLGLGFAESDHP